MHRWLPFILFELVAGCAHYQPKPLEPAQTAGKFESRTLRHQQRAWVYVQTDKARFTRRPILLKHASGDGWFISEGVRPSDRIVVSGAQVLLSEEVKSQIGFPE